MQIRKYAVKNMKEAITRIKDELGDDAVILTTRSTKNKTGGSYLEVTAAVDYDKNPIKAYKPLSATTPKPVVETEPVSGDGMEKIIKSLDGFEKRFEGIEALVNTDMISRKVDNLNMAISDIAHFLTTTSMDVQPIFSKTEKAIFNKLVFSGIREEEAIDMVSRMIDAVKGKTDLTIDAATNYLAGVFKNKIPLTDLNVKGRKVCALVGPTGMGKTTTLAKLASREIFTHNRSVGFITLDTFRIGAVEQLRTYANIINCPLEIARNNKDLTDKIAKMGNLDTIYIDTVGISPRDEKMMTQLGGFLANDVSVEPHLVLSASTRFSDLVKMTDQFNVLPVKSIIVSKIDEVESLGNIYSFVSDGRPPLSYFTTGQNVPDDIEKATWERVADMVLGISPAA